MSRSEWNACKYKLFKKCTLQRESRYINSVLKRSVYKSTFSSFYKRLVRSNRYPCYQSASDRAWTRCDTSKGGIVSSAEWNSCKYKLFKKCTITRYKSWITSNFRKSMYKTRFVSLYNYLARENRKRCPVYRRPTRRWKPTLKRWSSRPRRSMLYLHVIHYNWGYTVTRAYTSWNAAYGAWAKAYNRGRGGFATVLFD